MQYREVAWSQQLYLQRLLHGAGAEVTERSYPNYPGSALREIIRQSEHPHNVEPLLLTLRRPANTITRKRFAEVAGELVLIEKVTSSKQIATDFKVAMHGQIMDAADGILYPTKDINTKFETWLRVEMLDVLRMMFEEGLVRSLVPEMQAKLIEDMLQITADGTQHELIRLYAFCVAFAALKQFHAARAAALKSGFLQNAAAFFTGVIDQSACSADNALLVDPFERLKAITTFVEVLYFVSISSPQGEYSIAAAGVPAPPAAGPFPTIEQLQRQQHLDALVHANVAPLLVQAVQQAWHALQERNNFSYVPPARKCDTQNGSIDEAGEETLTEEQQKLKEEAEAAAAAASMTFDENWQAFLKAVYDTELVPGYALTAIQLGCGLLQLLEHAGVSEQPSVEMLQQLASYTKEPLLATTGSILLASTGGDAAAAQARGVDGSTAIVALPKHQELELAAYAKVCYACHKPEARDVKMLKCSACGCVSYCSAACQKADWKAGHKEACKDLGVSRAKLVAA